MSADHHVNVAKFAHKLLQHDYSLSVRRALEIAEVTITAQEDYNDQLRFERDVLATIEALP